MALILGLIKLQFVVALVLFFIGRFFGFNFKYLLIGVGLFYPVLYHLGFVVDMDQFLADSPEVVNSAALMSILDVISGLPFGIIFVVPVRVFVNLWAGLTFSRFFVSFNFIDYVSAFSNLFLGLLSSFYFYTVWRSRKIIWLGYGYEAIYFLMMFLFAMGLVPFLQSRYYWFLIPIFFLFFVMKIFGGGYVDRSNVCLHKR